MKSSAIKRLGQLQVELVEAGPPPSRRAFGTLVTIVCAVAAVSFALGLAR
jgi:hypothetical protein